MALPDLERVRRAWRTDDPERLMGRGHPVGDFLEAHRWRVLVEREGYLRLSVHLPDQVKNPRGELFGGFTPTYVDMVALHTVRAGHRGKVGSWLTTADMRVDYFAPIRSERFEIESEVLNRSGRTHHVQTRFLEPGDEETLTALAMTTLIELREPPAGA